MIFTKTNNIDFFIAIYFTRFGTVVMLLTHFVRLPKTEHITHRKRMTVPIAMAPSFQTAMRRIKQVKWGGSGRASFKFGVGVLLSSVKK